MLTYRACPSCPRGPLTRGCFLRERTLLNRRAAMPQGTMDIEQAPQLKIGDKLPYDQYFLVLDEEASEPRKVTVEEMCKGRRVVLFGLPGAYTSVCSSKHVPQFLERSEELASKGVQAIGCVSVNDPWVMRDWAKSLGVDVNKVLMLADGEADFTKAIGMGQYMPGLGVRSIRFSVLADDGVVKALNVEEKGGKSYKVSGPATMLKNLDEVGPRA